MLTVRCSGSIQRNTRRLLASRCWQHSTKLEAIEAQRRVQMLVSRIEFAIAHHDFPKARLYCEEERVARLCMERLLEEPPAAHV